MISAFIRAMRHGKYVVWMTYADYRQAAAGVEKYLAEERDLLEQRGISTLCVFPFPSKRRPWLQRHLSRYWGVLVDGNLIGFYDVPGLVGGMAQLHGAGKVTMEIQIHHLWNFDLAQVRRFLDAVPVPVRLYLHDYFTICPQYNLLRNDEIYCGDAPPSPEKCEDCRNWAPGHREAVGRLLHSVAEHLTVVAPSLSARQIWLHSFSEWEEKVVVCPHWKEEGERSIPGGKKNAEEPIRLAFVGAPRMHKGWPVFVRLSEELSSSGRDYEFYHLGSPPVKSGRIVNIPVSFVRQGAGAMTETLRRLSIDMVLFWALWPETYSYTLHESWLAGVRMMVSSTSGHIAHTVEREQLGCVFQDYSQLSGYLRNVDRVRKDIGEWRGRVRLPARFVPNDAIPLELAFASAPALNLTGTRSSSVRHVAALYGLKRLRQRLLSRSGRL